MSGGLFPEAWWTLYTAPLKISDGHCAVTLCVLRQEKVEQHGSAGLVWFTRTNPGSVQVAGGGAGHTLGLHDTVFVDSKQMQFWHLYSNFSLNWKSKPDQWLNWDGQGDDTDLKWTCGDVAHLARNAVRIKTSCRKKSNPLGPCNRHSISSAVIPSPIQPTYHTSQHIYQTLC